MSLIFYKILHLTGVIFLFLGLASTLMPKDTPNRKIGLIFHGLGLVILLVAGFGLIAKLHLGFPWWVVAKLVLWLAFGAMPLIGKRGLLPVPAAWLLAAICGIAAVWLGVTHGGAIGATLPSP
ncbi:MAG: hypothetical protein ACI9R3_003320 [Verrucomicrobiales bacterium]|jgi:hypothetical protein